MLRERLVSLDGVSLNGAAGDVQRPPLLLLHGVGRRWQDFAPAWPSLGERWEIHAFDFRGHVAAGLSPGRYRVCDYAAAIVRLTRTQLTEPAVLYGHSLG